MLHVTRDSNGSIASVAKEAHPGSEPMEENQAELVQFINGGASPRGFSESDAEFVRVLEDLIDMLIAKNLIRHTDLPIAAQNKLVQRKGMRNRLQGVLNLLDDDGQTL